MTDKHLYLILIPPEQSLIPSLCFFLYDDYEEKQGKGTRPMTIYLILAVLCFIGGLLLLLRMIRKWEDSAKNN